MTIEEIEEKLAELSAQKEQVMANANRQLGAIDGQIAVYKQWKQSMSENGVKAED